MHAICVITICNIIIPRLETPLETVAEIKNDLAILDNLKRDGLSLAERSLQM